MLTATFSSRGRAAEVKALHRGHVGVEAPVPDLHVGLVRETAVSGVGAHPHRLAARRR